MADAKVTDLTALTSPASGDFVYIVDVSASAGKKITLENLFHVQTTGTENVFMSSTGSPSATGQGNVTLGNRAAEALAGGNSNTVIGNKAGLNLIGVGDGNLFGALNTFIGSEAGGACTEGYANVAIGQKALLGITTQGGNIAIGKSAAAQSIPTRSVVIGQGACEINATTFSDSIYVGYGTGNTRRGDNNVVIGSSANTGTGSSNVVIGNQAATTAGSSTNTIGDCVIIGAIAGYAMTTGGSNVLIGRTAGSAITTEKGIVCVGAYAGQNGAGTGRNIILGFNAEVPSGTANTFVAGSTGDTGGSNIATITNVHFGNGVVAAVPVAYTVNGTGGKGTNIAGANVTLAGGKGTGTGAGGSVLLATAPVGSSGASLNSLVTAVEIDDEPTASATTRFLLLDLSSGTLKRVSFGASDSGGTGFKVLRVAN